MATGQIGGYDGWGLQPHKRASRLAGFPGINADVSAGKDGSQTGDLTGAHPGSDHPKPRVLGEMFFSLFFELCGENDVREVLTDTDGFNLADLHIFVLDLGLAGFQPFGGLEGYGDGGPFLGEGLVYQPPTDKSSHNRDKPHQREREGFLLFDDSFRGGGRISAAAIFFIHGLSPKNPR